MIIVIFITAIVINRIMMSAQRIHKLILHKDNSHILYVVLTLRPIWHLHDVLVVLVV